jgi:hypothetical protein
MLRREGWAVNRKRIWRLWKREAFKVPVKQRKKRRLGSSDNSIVRRRAEHKDHVWAWDFIHDRDRRGRPLKWLSLVDELTRECLALEVRRSMKAVDVIDVLAGVSADPYFRIARFSILLTAAFITSPNLISSASATRKTNRRRPATTRRRTSECQRR